MGYVAAAPDTCLFVHRTVNKATTLHVDDGIHACPTHQDAIEFFGPKGLGAHREITWGPLQNTLGIAFDVAYSPDRRCIFMHQRDYALQILERANMRDCNSVRTPAIPGHVYTKADCPPIGEKKEADSGGLNYHTIAASLNFLVQVTRDDMRFAQGKNAKYVANPGPPTTSPSSTSCDS